MIRLVHGADAHRYPREIDAMFRARAAVFSERLGWNVTVVDGRETDRFDAINPLYLIATDDSTGTICGSLRLLPTTGPNMLKECFAELFDEPVDIESATIWECTRFCLHPNVDVRASATGAMRTTWELMLGICEVGLRAGISQIQGVYDQSMVRVYKKTRWTPTPITRTGRLGSLPVFVGLWDVDEETLLRMRQVSGIASSVIEPVPSAPILSAHIAA
jgi:acyl homoserine lactone synthase